MKIYILLLKINIYLTEKNQSQFKAIIKLKI